LRKIIAILLLPLLLWANEVTGTVTDVTDGDTFTMTVNGEEKKVRLWGVDAPEKRGGGGQPYSNASMWFVKEMCLEKHIRVEIVDTDRYGRFVGVVFVPGQEKSLNELLCENGFAWWYEYYAPEAANLRAAEQLARTEKRGLWAGRNPINPFQWRKGER
jgi:micrococcal nuclease